MGVDREKIFVELLYFDMPWQQLKNSPVEVEIWIHENMTFI